MAKRKITYSIDEELAREIKILAAREDKPEYVVLEEALRSHLPSERFKRLVDRVRQPLNEEDATQLAVRESRSVRRSKGRAKQKSP